MNDDIDWSTLSISEVWDRAVGNQSAHEFVERGGTPHEYVEQTLGDLDESDKDIVKFALAEYIYRETTRRR